MIAGTGFTITDDLRVIEHSIPPRKSKVMPIEEIRELQAECEANRAVCLQSDDGVMVVSLQPLNDDSLELFVLLAVAHRHGAFKRQDAALRAIARDLGADAIAFRARRRGWARVLGPEWQRRGTDEFVRMIDGR